MLPFIKKSKWPRVAPPMEEKTVNGDPEDILEEHCISEMLEAVERKDIPAFRKALEALVLNMFDHEGDKDAA